MNLKVLSLNIWNLNAPLGERQDRIISYLRANRPHIVALQEVSPLGELRQCDLIASEVGYPYVYYTQNGYWQGREEGLAILTSLKSKELTEVTLPLAEGDMPRKLQLINISPVEMDSSFIVANTHLAFHIDSTTARVKQICAILGGITATGDNIRPLILCGDLNDTPESEPVRTLFSQKQPYLRDAWTLAGNNSEGHTFAKSNPWADSKLWPGRRIDYIAVSREFTVHSCHLVLTPNDCGPASDHYAVSAEISLF
jgi:endonuclease/exonuclease/phosphatase family metal-dependent hydrolase